MSSRADSRDDGHTEGGSILVSGTGRVSVTPDLADIRLGVGVAHPTVAGARAEAASIMTRILDAVTAAAVERRDVRTTNLSVQPRYDYRDGRAPALVGYDLSNVVEVTVRDLARLADVVDGALGAGATSMDGLSFRVADPVAAEREARLAAMAEARSRADVLAVAAGLTITGVADVVEGTAAGSPIPSYKAERMLMAADAGTPVASGSTEIAVTVTVRFRTA
ncbi:MAG: SIMPL domain-containing protein [Chloroflexota bacterium]